MLVLAQGTVYWALKHRQLRGRHRVPRGLRLFRHLPRINLLALSAALATIIASAPSHPGRDYWPGLAFLAFAALEHVNYFSHQLMYADADSLRWLVRHRSLRRSQLRRDLDRYRRDVAARASTG